VGEKVVVAAAFSTEELDRRCYPIFEQLLGQLGDRYHNWLVVIEPDSEEYFLGQDDYEVLARARKKHPRAVFFTYRMNENPVVDYLY
jgi:hypothetical protein